MEKPKEEEFKAEKTPVEHKSTGDWLKPIATQEKMILDITEDKAKELWEDTVARDIVNSAFDES